MKHIITFVLIFCVSISIAQVSSIVEANKLIDLKKYDSAFNILNDADPDNKSPEITIAKTDLVLNYFVNSFMHQMFALKDLEPEENILDIRGSEGNFSMYKFTPDSALIKLIEKYPNNFKLQKELGYYYHEVHLKYQSSWLIPDSILVDKFKDNYLNAYKNGEYDYWSTYGIGYAYLIIKDYASSIPFFEESAKLNKEYPSSLYNLAYAYLYTDQREKGIECAKKAFDLYDYPQYKADAARMIAVMYRELEDTVNALEFYRQADGIQPNDYYTLNPLLEFEVALNIKSYKDRTKQFFLIAPENPTIYKDLMRIYWSKNKPDELLNFFTEQKSDYSSDYKVLGNLYFYSAIVQYDKEDFENAKQNFHIAKEVFNKVFDSDHQVFKAIESYTVKL